MTYTRQQIRDRLRINELKIDPNARVWSDSALNANIKTARERIQQDGGYDWYFNDGEDSSTTTAIGTQEYTLPDNFVRLELAKYDGSPLSPTTKKYLKATNRSLTSNGRPAQYYLLGNKIGLWLRPDDAKTLDLTYRKKLDDLATDADVEVMPDEFVEAIVQYSAYLSWSDIQGREDKAIQAMQNYKEAIEGLYSQYLGMRDDADILFKYETI